MKSRSALWMDLCLGVSAAVTACGSSSTAIFAATYGAAKAISRATATGVTYDKFGELLQNLTTEIGIVKDHPLNDREKQLLALFEQVQADYQASATLWNVKLEARESAWLDEIPVAMQLHYSDEPVTAQKTLISDDIVAKYKLPVTTRELFPRDGSILADVRELNVSVKTTPALSLQLVWRAAGESLKKATDAYLGEDGPVTITRKVMCA
jgi:hypothetical protein